MQPNPSTKAPARHVGTAGWSVPRQMRDAFADGASILARYASRFDTVEINSSFYRPHRRQTYERWAGSVPEAFTFAVKAPRQVTHNRRLVDTTNLLAAFRREVDGLGGKLGPILIQLPPSLVFDDQVVGRFLATWRELFDGLTVCEPRHASWLSDTATRRLAEARVERVIADPPLGAASAEISGSGDCAYYRLHGSPEMYASAYGIDRLGPLAKCLAQSALTRPTWCIFDNTKFGAATTDALILRRRLDGAGFS